MLLIIVLLVGAIVVIYMNPSILRLLGSKPDAENTTTEIAEKAKDKYEAEVMQCSECYKYLEKLNHEFKYDKLLTVQKVECKSVRIFENYDYETKLHELISEELRAKYYTAFKKYDDYLVQVDRKPQSLYQGKLSKGINKDRYIEKEREMCQKLILDRDTTPVFIIDLIYNSPNNAKNSKREAKTFSLSDVI